MIYIVIFFIVLGIIGSIIEFVKDKTEDFFDWLQDYWGLLVAIISIIVFAYIYYKLNSPLWPILLLITVVLIFNIFKGIINSKEINGIYNKSLGILKRVEDYSKEHINILSQNKAKIKESFSDMLAQNNQGKPLDYIDYLDFGEISLLRDEYNTIASELSATPYREVFQMYKNPYIEFFNSNNVPTNESMFDETVIELEQEGAIIPIHNLDAKSNNHLSILYQSLQGEPIESQKIVLDL